MVVHTLESCPFPPTHQVLFEKVFFTRPWKALFVTTDDDIREWWFRWRLDRYR